MQARSRRHRATEASACNVVLGQAATHPGRSAPHEAGATGPGALKLSRAAGLADRRAKMDLRPIAQVVAVEPAGPDGHGVNWLDGKPPKPGDLLYRAEDINRGCAGLREAAQNALVTLDGIADTNPLDTADFETPAEWIACAKSRARWAADALRVPVAQEIHAERILKQMMDEAQRVDKTRATCGFVGQEDPVKGCPKCGFDDMRAKAAEHRDGRLSALEDVAVLRGERGVLVRLLVEADKVLSTLEGESTDEQEMLEGLRRQILAATAQHRPQESDLLSVRAGLGA